MKTNEISWRIKNDCLMIYIPYVPKNGWNQEFLLTSDIHIDSKKCNRNLLKKHLSQLESRNAFWIDNGDMYDMMGGKYDKRSTKADILPELNTSKYFDSCNDFAINTIGQQAANRMICMADGNHELSVVQRHEFNPLDRLAEHFNANGANIIRQGYVGWIRFYFYKPIKKTQKDNLVSATKSFTMYRTHGTGGNAPVTKGIIQSARRQDMVSADMYISGHIHTNATVPRPMWRLNQKGVVEMVEPIHHFIGTYKDSTWSTWENMKGFAPPSIGGSWMKFHYESGQIHVAFERAV